MTLFAWIVLELAGLLMLFSAVCAVVALLLDDTDWRKLGVKTFRLSLVPVLLYINVVIYKHIVLNLV